MLFNKKELCNVQSSYQLGLTWNWPASKFLWWSNRSTQILRANSSEVQFDASWPV